MLFRSQYVVLTPTFVERGGLQYALYTFTVKDDSATAKSAETAELMGGVEYATATQDLVTPQNAKVTPTKTISIFIEYNNTMMPDGEGGYRTDAGGQTNGAWADKNYLDVYEESNTGTLDEWKTVGKLKRNAGTGTNIPGEEFVTWQTENAKGEYDAYLGKSPQYGQNAYGSFYKLMSDATDHEAVTAYWTAYDAAIAKGATQQAARVAGAQASMAILNGPEGTITNDLKNGVTMLKGEQAVGANNRGEGKTGALGQYVSWPKTGSTLWYSQYYATATKREDALV